MFGLEPFAIAKMFQERSAMLQSVREGILAVEKESHITIVNEEGMRLFEKVGIVDDPIGKKVDEYVPNTRLMHILQIGKAELDQEQDLHGMNGLELVTTLQIGIKSKNVHCKRTWKKPSPFALKNVFLPN